MRRKDGRKDGWAMPTLQRASSSLELTAPPPAKARRIHDLPTAAPHAIKISVAPWCAVMRAAPPFGREHEPRRSHHNFISPPRAFFRGKIGRFSTLGQKVSRALFDEIE